MMKKSRILAIFLLLPFMFGCNKNTTIFTFENNNKYIVNNGCRLFYGSQEKDIFLDRIVFFLNEKKDYETFKIEDVSFANIKEISEENIYYIENMGKGKNINVHFMYFDELENYDELVKKINFINEKTDFFSYLGVYYLRKGTHLA